MTYFLKDCGREVSPPAKEREDIARAVTETFATRPYIRFALFIEPYADGSGDDISGGDALEAACLANRFADKLLADGRPAFHIEAQLLPRDTSER